MTTQELADAIADQLSSAAYDYWVHADQLSFIEQARQDSVSAAVASLEELAYSYGEYE